jgi:hypothetical protein
LALSRVPIGMRDAGHQDAAREADPSLYKQ